MCTFAASAGSGTIPASLMGKLPVLGSATGAASIMSTATKKFTAGNYDVSLTIIPSMQTGLFKTSN
jgi:hypothetical protein